MKKEFFHYLSILLLLSGCATSKKVVDNTFYCSSPKLEIVVSSEFDYVGEKMYLQDQKELAEGRDVTIRRKLFIFQAQDRVLGITLVKAPRDATWLAPDFDEVKDRINYGKQKLGGRQYHYCTYKNGPYIERVFMRNAQGATVQIIIIYRESALEMKSEEEQLRIFNTNCAAAFMVR